MTTAPIAQALWDHLWQAYRQRVSYARTYETMITAAGGTVANDHIAFRSLRLAIDGPQGTVNLGIQYLAEIAEWLGYEVAGEYHFPDRYLYARHYRHPAQEAWDLPKLFISELKVDALPAAIAQQICDTVQSGQFFAFTQADKPSEPPTQIAKTLVPAFTRPWQPPRHQVVTAVNEVSQYGAWVLLHGYAVNHFTGFINRQQTPRYANIQATAAALAQLGVPMKDRIEGSVAGGLQQTATQAVVESVSVWDEMGGAIAIPWSYAYYELAERHPVLNPETGISTQFDGFIGPQAQHLFEMTRNQKILST